MERVFLYIPYKNLTFLTLKITTGLIVNGFSHNKEQCIKHFLDCNSVSKVGSSNSKTLRADTLYIIHIDSKIMGQTLSSCMVY